MGICNIQYEKNDSTVELMRRGKVVPGKRAQEANGIPEPCIDAAV